MFDPLPGLFIGIAVSLLLLIYRASRPYIATLGRTPGPDGHYRDVVRQVVADRVLTNLYATVEAAVDAADRTPR